MANLKMSDAEFEKSMKRLAAEEVERARFSPVAIMATYVQNEHVLKISLNNGLQLAISPDNLQLISEFEPQELSQVKVSPMGDLIWEETGHGIAVRSLLEGRFGSRKWMEKLHAEQGIPLGEWSDSPVKREEWARAAGSMTSPKKKASSRANGKKGGRPRKAKLSMARSKEEAIKEVALKVNNG